MRAAQASEPDAVALLLASRASPHTKDEDGMTPLHFAAAAGCKESCKHLLAAGARRSVQDDNMRPALACVPAEALLAPKERAEWAELLGPGAEGPSANAKTGAEAAPEG
mmetsp:Transcript_49152/g.157153  ORF Transcript_49152/g.157153 Transcript_49152/m.157153 type:complete len:109 (+) Transcript_49152:1-327(+)